MKETEFVLTFWARIRSGLLETVEMFRKEELGYSPYPCGRTVRQIILHIAQEERGEFGYGIKRDLDRFPVDYDDQDYSSFESIRDLLQDVHLPTVRFLEQLTMSEFESEILTPWGARYRMSEMFWHIIEHEIHHRGELSLIHGMLRREGFDA